MNDTLKVTETTETKYEYAESNQRFSENSHFDHRPQYDSWGFSFYSYKEWRKCDSRVVSREQAIEWAEKYIGNEITSYAGSYKLRETIHSVTISEGEGIYEKVERNSIVEFHTMQRNTIEQKQMSIQYEADSRDLSKNFIDVQVSLGFRKPVVAVETTEHTVAECDCFETSENSVKVPDVEKKKNWFQKVFL